MSPNKFMLLTVIVLLISQIRSNYTIWMSCNACPQGTKCPSNTTGNSCVYWMGGYFNNQLQGCEQNCSKYPKMVTVSECPKCPAPSCCMMDLGITSCAPLGTLADKVCKFPSEGLEIWQIALIAVGGILVIGLVVLIVYKKCSSRRKQPSPSIQSLSSRQYQKLIG